MFAWAARPSRMASEPQFVRKNARSDWSVSSHDGCCAWWTMAFMAAKLTGEASIALLFRYLSASRLVTIAQISKALKPSSSK